MAVPVLRRRWRVTRAALAIAAACAAIAPASHGQDTVSTPPREGVAPSRSGDSTAHMGTGNDPATLASVSTLAVGRVGDSARGQVAGDPVVDAVREYERTGIARTIEEGAFVTFPYGHAQPTVTCAPLRACVIELESGEAVLSKIAGDTQRWEIQLALAGADGRTPLIVVKPHDCALTTNLVLTTTGGRIYDLTLDSPPCTRGTLNPVSPYMRHVRFYYPDAMVQAWAAPPSATTPRATAARADAFNFGYRIRRDHGFPWNPLAVFDDGVHCYIKAPPHAARRDVPVLFALADDGGRTLLNYTFTNDTYVTDRIFRAAVLVLGEGGAQRVLRMDNVAYDAGSATSNGEAGGAGPLTSEHR